MKKKLLHLLVEGRTLETNFRNTLIIHPPTFRTFRMVKPYYRIVPENITGMIASPHASIHYYYNHHHGTMVHPTSTTTTRESHRLLHNNNNNNTTLPPLSTFSSLILSPLLYQIGIWNTRENSLIQTILPQDESYYGGSIHEGTMKYSNITCLSYSPPFIAAGYQNGKILIYNLQTQQQVLYATGHSSSVTCLQFNKDTSLLMSGGDDTDIVCWDVTAGQSKYRLRGHKGRITGLLFLEKSNALISSSKDMLIKIWELTTCHCVQTLIGSRNEIWSICVDPFESRLFAGSTDSEIRVWNIQVFQNKKSQYFYENDPIFMGTLKRRDESRVLQMKFDPSGTLLGVIGADSKILEIFKLRSEKEMEKKKNSNVTSTTPNMEYKWWLQVKSNYELRSFDFSPYEKCYDLNREEMNNEQEVTSTMDSTIDTESTTNSTTNTTDPTTTTNTDPTTTTTMDTTITTTFKNPYSSQLDDRKPSNFKLIVSTLRNTIEEYNIEPSKLVKIQQNDHSMMDGISCTHIIERQGHGTPVRAIAISPDDPTICLSLSSKECHIWNLETMKCIKSLNDVEHGLCALWIPSTNHRYCLIGTKKGNIQIYDVNLSECIENIQAHSASVYSIQFIPPSQENDYNGGIMSASSDKTVKFWEFEMKTINSRSSITTTTPHKKQVLSLAIKNVLEMNEEIIAMTISKNGKYLALSLLDNTVKIFYLDTMKFFLSLYGHKLPIKCLDISSDEQLIVTGSDDKNIKIWGLDFGDCHRSLLAHEQGISAIKFIPDTHYFFSASKDGNVKYWDGDKFELIQVVTSQYISKSPLWCMDVSSDGLRMVVSGHERALFIYRQSQEDLLFLEEEKEKRFEEEQLEKDLPHSQQFKDLSLPGMEVTHAGQRSMETIRDGEKLMESLEIAMNEEIESMQNNHSTTISNNPLLLSLTIEEYVWKCLTGIARSDLDMVLSIIHFSHAYFILKQLDKLMKKKSVDVELSTRIILLLIHIHYKQLVQSQSDQDTFDLMQSLHEHVKSALQEQSQRIGFNIAALNFIKNRMKNEQELFEFTKQANVNDIVKSYREKQREKRRIAKYEQEQANNKKKKIHKRMSKFKGLLESMIEKMDNDPTKQVIFESNDPSLNNKQKEGLKRRLKDLEDKNTKKLKEMIYDPNEEEEEDLMNELASWD